MNDTLYFLKMAAIGTLQGMICISAMFLSGYMFYLTIWFLKDLIILAGVR